MAAKKSRHQTPEEKGKYMKKKRAQSSPRRKSCGVSTPIEDRSPGRDAGCFFRLSENFTRSSFSVIITVVEGREGLL